MAASAARLSGKVAIITASTDGIGLAIARRFGLEGAKVAISSRGKENVARAVGELKKDNIECFGTVCHVGKEDDRDSLVSQIVKNFGGVDIFVGSAGVNPSSGLGPVLETTEEIWDKPIGTYGISKTALLGLTKTLAQELAERNIRVNESHRE